MAKLKLLLLSVALLFSAVAGAQSQQELIQQAKAMGVSQSQINKALNSQNNTLTDPIIESKSQVVREVSDTLLSGQKLYEIDKLPKSGSTIFGRELFSTKNLTFAPNYNIPTPKGYVLSSGDEVVINIWGDSELNLVEQIDPEGRIFVEKVGPIQLKGLTIETAQSKVKNALSKVFSGLENGSNTLSLSLGKIRSINVNIVGEATMPGSYTLPSFATLFNAIYVAGGVNDIGSLRSIKLYRNNKLVSTLDAYDYILKGNSESNARLESDDMIVIEPYDALVATSGAVKRARTYEMKSNETLLDLIDMTGGFKGSARTNMVRVKRSTDGIFKMLSVDESDFANFKMYDTDSVSFDNIADRFDNRIDIEGAVWYDGSYELGDKISTVRALVEAAGGLRGDEFAGRAQIIRRNPDFTERVIAVDILDIMNGGEDVSLVAYDKLVIPSKSLLQERYTIKVSGAINDSLANNGSVVLTYRDNMTVEDAIVLAGGIKESAATVNVDISRRIKDAKSTERSAQIVEVFAVELVDGLALDKSGNPITLQPFDEVYVRYSPGYRTQEVVSVSGEVLFKGDYVLQSVNARLSDIIKDAGGIAPEAYVNGASLLRRMNESEQQRVKTLLSMNRSEESKDSVAVSMDEIREYSVGIDLKKALANPGGVDDLVLRDGDRIYVPKQQTTVQISGSVVYPNSVTFTKQKSAKKYLSQAGGYNDYARKRPIVIYMNGQVASTKNVWIFFKRYPKVEPGSQIIVPTKRENQRKTTAAEIIGIATSVTSIAALVSSMVK